MDYEKGYKLLFNAITTAINQIEKSRVFSEEMEHGLMTLKSVQQISEEMYINEE